MTDYSDESENLIPKMSKGRQPPVNQAYVDRRTNPHLEEYDPRYVSPSPRPVYQQFPQPRYPVPNHVPNHVAFGGDRYDSKPFNYQYDDRYFRMTEQQYRQQQEQQRQYEEQQQQRMMDERYRQNRPAAPAYGPAVHQYNSDERSERYHDMPPAGRANKYNVRITDLLTSLREPQLKDDYLRKMTQENKGYLVLMRFRPDFLSSIVSAMQSSTSTLSADNGYVIGFSDPKYNIKGGQSNIRMMEVLLANYQGRSGEMWWQSNDQTISQYGTCCLWFKDFTSAKNWFESAPKIKEKSFPEHHPFQAVAVPLTFGGNAEPLPFSPATQEITLLWSEYPRIYERYEDDFLQNYSEPARRRIKYYGGTPYVSVSRFRPGWPEEPNKYGQPEYFPKNFQHERVGRPLRNSWLEPDTFITVSTFPSMQSLKDFFNDSEYQRCLANLHRYSAPVFVAMTVQFIRGTRQK